MQAFDPLSQYLCGKCGSILKETNVEIEISTVNEDCPNCGALLSHTLRKRTIKAETRKPAAFQTAYELTRFKFGIKEIDNFMSLSTTGMIAISGYNANLLLTRLYVRSLLHAKYGGLGSPYVIIVDAGNKSDFYQTVNFIKQYGMHLSKTLDRIIVSRTFTIYQLKGLLQKQLPQVIEKYMPNIVILPGLLDLFEDPNIKKREAKRVIERIMKLINEISRKLLVITTTVNENKYSSLVLPSFEKRIVLTNTGHSRVNAALYNEGKKANITITQKDLTLVRQK